MALPIPYEFPTFDNVEDERRHIKIRLAAPAMENRANEALIEFLAAHYRVPRRNVRIASGLKSRDKRVVIEGARGLREGA